MIVNFTYDFHINLFIGTAGVINTLRASISVSFPFSLSLFKFKNWNSRFWYALLTQCDQVCMHARANVVMFECFTCQIHGNDFERTESNSCFVLYCILFYSIVLISVHSINLLQCLQYFLFPVKIVVIGLVFLFYKYAQAFIYCLCFHLLNASALVFHYLLMIFSSLVVNLNSNLFLYSNVAFHYAAIRSPSRPPTGGSHRGAKIPYQDFTTVSASLPVLQQLRW